MENNTDCESAEDLKLKLNHEHKSCLSFREVWSLHKIYPEDEMRKKGRNACVYTLVQSTWVRKIPWRMKWQLTPVFLPGESHGQRSLAGYSPKGHNTVRHNWVTEHTHQKVLISKECRPRSEYFEHLFFLIFYSFPTNTYYIGERE